MRIVIVGAGVVGLAHALTALEHGHAVTVLERDGRARGASVRNFGTLWPIGCVPGPEREQALFGVRRWRRLAAELGLWLRPQGSLALAHRDEAWAVLREFATTSPGQGYELLDADAAARRFPAVRRDGLQGALYSGFEAVVQPADAMRALARHVAEQGAEVRFGAPVVKVHDGAVETSDGRRSPFDQLVIAAGDDMRTLFPAELAAAPLTRCRLQMLRTAPQPEGYDLGAILVSDLTLCHYPAFRDCPSTPRLRERLIDERPRHHANGVHVIVAQHPDRSLVIGDSHEYADDFAPEHRTEIDELVLDALQQFVRPPELRIDARWSGVYLKSTVGTTEVVLRPRPRVTMVTALGGLGMTLSFGLAARTVAAFAREGDHAAP